MSTSKVFTAFLVGATAGATLALLFAPKSGEDLRNEIVEKGENALKQARRRVRRSVEHVQDLVDKGNHRVTSVLDSSKSALEALADSID